MSSLYNSNVNLILEKDISLFVVMVGNSHFTLEYEVISHCCCGRSVVIVVVVVVFDLVPSADWLILTRALISMNRRLIWYVRAFFSLPLNGTTERGYELVEIRSFRRGEKEGEGDEG